MGRKSTREARRRQLQRLVDKLDMTEVGELLTDFGLLTETASTKPRTRSDDAIE
ncbi:hypothetical protein BH09ACT6_BH09ACT6_12160 [soil metagenome]